MGKLSRLALVCAPLLACGCASNPKPDDASQKDGQTTTASAEPETTVDTGPANDPGKPMGTGVKATGLDRNDDGSVPDDYNLVEGDCIALGKKLGDLWRRDLRATLSPKLNEKQREKAEQSIEEGATKKEDDWANGCIKSLVGKSVDPKAMKCAFDSKDLKTFEKCLN